MSKPKKQPTAYRRVLTRFQEFTDKIRNRQTKSSFWYCDATVKTSGALSHIKDRVGFAKELGYETHVTIDANGGLRFRFVEELDVPYITS